MGEKNSPPKRGSGKRVSPEENQVSVRLRLAGDWIRRILLMAVNDQV